MKWEVSGADRETGEERAVKVEADNENDAKRLAGRKGLLVAGARPMIDRYSVTEGQPATESVPSLAGLQIAVVMMITLTAICIVVAMMLLIGSMSGPVYTEPMQRMAADAERQAMWISAAGSLAAGALFAWAAFTADALRQHIRRHW